MAIGGCSTDHPRDLVASAHSKGIAYNVKYDDKRHYICTAAYTLDHAKELKQITDTLQYRCLARVKADGYSLVKMVTQYGRYDTTQSYAGGPARTIDSTPGINVSMWGFKEGEPESLTYSKELLRIDDLQRRLADTVKDAGASGAK